MVMWINPVLLTSDSWVVRHQETAQVEVNLMAVAIWQNGTPKRSVGIGPRNENTPFLHWKNTPFLDRRLVNFIWISWCFRPRLPTCFHVLPILVDQTWKRIVETWNIIFLAKHIPNVSQLCATYAIESLLQGLVEVMDLCVARLKQTRKSSE